MNKFFVPDEIYKDRISICRECVYYLNQQELVKIAAAL